MKTTNELVTGPTGLRVTVTQSLDPSWRKWTVIAPGINCAWYDTKDQALLAAKSLVTPFAVEAR